MNLKERLTKQYKNILSSNSELAERIECIAQKLGVETDIFLKGIFKYDIELGTYDNTAFEDIAVKGAMYFKQYIPDSFHIERHNILADMVSSCTNIKSLIDIGYGAPGKYVRDILKEKRDVSVTLADRFESSRLFSEALFSCLDLEWKNKVTLKEFDMNNMKAPGVFDLYIFFDSIEHTKDPDGFFQLTVNNAPKGAYFILSLPIGHSELSGGSNKEPMHYVEWLSVKESKEWVKSFGLKIIREEIARPKKGDFWVEVKEDFYNYIVKAVKN
jgi:hypothetical protein